MGLVSQHVALLLTSVSLLAPNKVTFGPVSETSYSIDIHSHFRISAVRTLHLVELDSFQFLVDSLDSIHRRQMLYTVCFIASGFIQASGIPGRRGGGLWCYLRTLHSGIQFSFQESTVYENLNILKNRDFSRASEVIRGCSLQNVPFFFTYFCWFVKMSSYNLCSYGLQEIHTHQ